MPFIGAFCRMFLAAHCSEAFVCHLDALNKLGFAQFFFFLEKNALF